MALHGGLTEIYNGFAARRSICSAYLSTALGLARNLDHMTRYCTLSCVPLPLIPAS